MAGPVHPAPDGPRGTKRLGAAFGREQGRFRFELFRDPAPLGKFFDVIQRGFFRAGTRQAAFELRVSQFATLHDAPRIVLGLRAVRKGDGSGPFMLQADPVSDRRRGLLQGALEIDAPHRALIGV